MLPEIDLKMNICPQLGKKIKPSPTVDKICAEYFNFPLQMGEEERKMKEKDTKRERGNEVEEKKERTMQERN